MKKKEEKEKNKTKQSTAQHNTLPHRKLERRATHHKKLIKFYTQIHSSSLNEHFFLRNLVDLPACAYVVLHLHYFILYCMSAASESHHT